jgi:hypothetical protein
MISKEDNTLIDVFSSIALKLLIAVGVCFEYERQRFFYSSFKAFLKKMYECNMQ